MATARLTINDQMKMVKKSIIYDCQKCGYSGKFFDVRRHYGSAHLSVQQAPFACYICEKPFGAFTELERHIKQKNHEKRVQQMSASDPELELSQGMEFPVMVNAAREVLGELSVKLPIGHSSRVTFRSRRSRWFVDPRFCVKIISHMSLLTRLLPLIRPITVN